MAHDQLTAVQPSVTAGSQPIHIVGFGGTFREGSSSEQLVASVLGEAEKLGATTQLFKGSDLAALPHYAPDVPLTPEQTAFVEAVRKANAVIIGTPVYHGGVSGLVKNGIDTLSELIRDTRPYLDGRPVGLVVAAGGLQGAGMTLSALRDMVHSLRGWPTPVGVAVNTGGQPIFDDNGGVVDQSVRRAIVLQAQQLVSFSLSPALA